MTHAYMRAEGVRLITLTVVILTVICKTGSYVIAPAHKRHYMRARVISKLLTRLVPWVPFDIFNCFYYIYFYRDVHHLNVVIP